MAEHDLPTAVAAILERTDAPQVDYVGFSMGGMLLYASLGHTLPAAQVRRVAIMFFASDELNAISTPYTCMHAWMELGRAHGLQVVKMHRAGIASEGSMAKAADSLMATSDERTTDAVGAMPGAVKAEATPRPAVYSVA